MTPESYAAALLDSLGVDAVTVPPASGPYDLVADWAASGAMALTGRADGPPLLAGGTPATALRGALLALAVVGRAAGLQVERLPGVELLGERAAIAGLTRQAPASPGGGTRLLAAADGPVAVTLARPEDDELLPALLMTDRPLGDRWDEVAAWAQERPAVEVADRAQLLGLAAAALGPGSPRPAGLVDVPCQGPLSWRQPLVVDLSSLWAGPLCSHLLRLLGARVVTVESTRRPDGARRGPRAFHDLLREGTRSVALDFASTSGREALRQLLGRADVVVEGSRPRALRQLGIDAAEHLPGRTWVSITAYGRGPGDEDRIGYGDDTGVAGGLVAWEGKVPVLAGDAIADPLTGVHAAVAALAGALAGGGRLVDVAMRSVVAACVSGAPERRVWQTPKGWCVDGFEGPTPVAAPQSRLPAGAAPALGQHTAEVLSSLGVVLPC
ncbi:MAG: hypothetical protein JWL64_2676 [Frankiales bacterium]|nr:hypothetical protein [Frankiales bacterium]